jgi:hypothetical protein
VVQSEILQAIQVQMNTLQLVTTKFLNRAYVFTTSFCLADRYQLPRTGGCEGSSPKNHGPAEASNAQRSNFLSVGLRLASAEEVIT